MTHPLEQLASVSLDPTLRRGERNALNAFLTRLGEYTMNPFTRLSEIEDHFLAQGIVVEERIDRGGITKYREQTTRHIYKLYRSDETEITNSALVLTVCYVGPRHEVVAYVS